MKKRIIEILNEINSDIVTYSGEDMVEDGIIDSLEIMEIVTELEKEFGFKITIDDIVPENFMNVEAIIGFVESKI